MADVEFVTDGGDGDGDDVIDFGPRRRPPRWTSPRWLAPAALGLAAVVVVAVLVGRSHHAAPQAGDSTVPAPGSLPASVAPILPQTAAFGGAVTDLVVADRRLYALTDGTLGVADLLQPGGTTRELQPALDDTDGHYELVLDSLDSTIWIVPIDGAPGPLRGYATDDLRLVTSISVPVTINAAAVLGGVLYLATAHGLLVRQSGGHSFTAVHGPTGAITALVADSARSRLLYLGGGSPVDVHAWSPGSAAAATARLPFAKGSLVVITASIWAGGYGDHGAVLVRLDPDTLRPGANNILAPQLGPGAVIAAGGDRDLFVRSGANPDPLWCVDAQTGAVQQNWPSLNGSVAAQGGYGFVATASGVQSLDFRGCDG